MVQPDVAIVRRDVADLRAMPSADSELVDQTHYGENVQVLGESGDWRYVQGADQYFGTSGSMTSDQSAIPPERLRTFLKPASQRMRQPSTLRSPMWQ